MSLGGMLLLGGTLVKHYRDKSRAKELDKAIETAPWDDGQKRMAHWAAAIMSMGSFKERRKLIVYTAKQWGISEETTWSVLATTIRFMRGD